jgi:glutamate carboxypeptidase
VAGGGPVNVVPDHARAQIDLRVRRAADVERATGRLTQAADEAARRHEVRIEVGVEMNRPPMESGERAAALFAAYRACAGELGTAVDWIDAGGGSDANILTAAGLPCLDGLGPRGGLPHSSEEYCVLPSLPERAAIAARFLARLAAGAVPLPERP